MTVVKSTHGGETALFIGGQRVCFRSVKFPQAIEGRIDDSSEAICGGPVENLDRILKGLEMVRFTIECRPTFGELDMYLKWMGFSNKSGRRYDYLPTAVPKDVWINYGLLKAADIKGAVVDKARLVGQRGGMPALLTLDCVGTRTILQPAKNKANYGSLLGGTPLPFTGGTVTKAGVNGNTLAVIDVNRALIAVDNHAQPVINAQRYADQIDFGGHATTYFGFGQSVGADTWSLITDIRDAPGKTSATWKTFVGGSNLEFTFPALDEPTQIPSIDGRNDDLDMPHYLKAGSTGGNSYYAEHTFAGT